MPVDHHTIASVIIQPSYWTAFKRLAKIRDTSASRELRRYIRQQVDEAVRAGLLEPIDPDVTS